MPKIYGRNAVLEALRAGQRSIERIFLAQAAHGSTIEKICEIAQSRNIICERVSKEKIDILTGRGSHQGVVAIAGNLKFKELPSIITHLTKSKITPFFLMADSVEDPRNLGSMIRTASAAGVHAVIIPKRRTAGITETVIKASAGAIECVNLVRISNMVNCCRVLKKNGIWIIGAEAGSNELWYGADFTLPLALVIGGEDRGLPRLLRTECDFFVSLPMKSSITSLNISVAAGIVMYEVIRQRNIAPTKVM